MFLGDGSNLHSSSRAEIWGDVVAAAGCTLSLGEIALHGSLWLDSFTNANLSRTTVDGVVECHRGADAFCDTGVTASVSGCASAGQPCTGASPTESDSMRERRSLPVVDERLVNPRKALDARKSRPTRESE